MREYLIQWLKQLGIETTPLVIVSAVITVIVLVSIIIHLFLHLIVLGTIKRQHKKQPRVWTHLFLDHGLFQRLALTIQGMIIHAQINLWMPKDSFIHDVAIMCAEVWIMVFGLLSLFSVFNTLNDLLSKSKIAAHLPLKGIFQSLKLIALIIVGIMIVSLLIGRSPAVLLSGLGAMTAVLMLVFKDPILGLVAGFQLATNNMLRVGDWLEMPKYGADGDVIDIGLTTVKVQNWDKTITTIPTYALISDSFINWRGMSESGGRRIKRNVNIDTTSIHFLNDAEMNRLNKAQLLSDYLTTKSEEIKSYNQTLNADLSVGVNGRRLTNVGTFRAYLETYLNNHPHIHKGMTIMVRQMEPTSNGLPIQIYAFTNTTAWGDYENIQSDIFDHIFAILPEFDLRVHQTPTGSDFRQLGQRVADASE